MTMYLMRVVFINEPRRTVGKTSVKVIDTRELLCHYEVPIMGAGMQWNISWLEAFTTAPVAKKNIPALWLLHAFQIIEVTSQ
jgi:hypothetical protein